MIMMVPLQHSSSEWKPVISIPCIFRSDLFLCSPPHKSCHISHSFYACSKEIHLRETWYCCSFLTIISWNFGAIAWWLPEFLSVSEESSMSSLHEHLKEMKYVSLTVVHSCLGSMYFFLMFLIFSELELNEDTLFNFFIRTVQVMNMSLYRS